MIDKRITTALVFTILVQTAGVLFWSGAAAQRLAQVERRLAEQATLAERLARIEAQISDLARALDRLDRTRDGRSPR